MGLDRVDELEARVQGLERAGDEFRRTLTRMGDALASTHDRPAMVSAVLEAVVLYLTAERGVFFELVAGANRLRAVATFGVTGPVADIAFGEGLAGGAAETGEVVVWPASAGAGSGARVRQPGPAEPGEPRGPAPVAMAVPVRSGGQPYGVLALYGRVGGRPYSPEEEGTARTLVRQAETAIENSYLYEEARHLSLTDGLTGLWNWRHFEMRLAEEMSRAVRFRETFSVVTTDLDGFKQVNDTHGHQTGHSVLVELARRVMETTREVDLIARLGGDELGLLLPRTGLAGALRLSEKVRAAVVDEPFSVEDLRLPVTMSLGVAAYPEHGLSGKDLMAAADSALYRAKGHGGNRVEHAKVGSAPGPERPDRAGDTGPERPDRAGDTGPERPDRAGDTGPEQPDRAGDTGPERPDRAGDTGPERPDRAGDAGSDNRGAGTVGVG